MPIDYQNLHDILSFYLPNRVGVVVNDTRETVDAVIAALQAAEALDAHIMQRADWPLAKWLIKLGELTGAVQTNLAALPQSPPPAAGAGQ